MTRVSTIALLILFCNIPCKAQSIALRISAGASTENFANKNHIITDYLHNHENIHWELSDFDYDDIQQFYQSFDKNKPLDFHREGVLAYTPLNLSFSTSVEAIIGLQGKGSRAYLNLHYEVQTNKNFTIYELNKSGLEHYKEDSSAPAYLGFWRIHTSNTIGVGIERRIDPSFFDINLIFAIRLDGTYVSSVSNNLFVWEVDLDRIPVNTSPFKDQPEQTAIRYYYSIFGIGVKPQLSITKDVSLNSSLGLQFGVGVKQYFSKTPLTRMGTDIRLAYTYSIFNKKEPKRKESVQF